MYPDLVADAIRSFNTDEIWELFEFIDRDLWSDRRVAHAWLAKGGNYLHEVFPDEFKNDKEAFLLIAEHFPPDFQYASEYLCNNKEFLMQVVDKNATLFKNVSSRLARDFDLALVAFGGSGAQSRDLAGSHYDVNDRDDLTFLFSFALKVRAKIVSHDNFVKRVLCGMSARHVDGDGFHLPLLDQGDETSLAYKKLLAEFLGVPMGSELRLLRRASTNLAIWGY